MRPCQRFEEGLILLAEGGEAPEAAIHSEECAACAQRLAEWKQILGADAIKVATWNAPPDWVDQAAAIMPEPRRAGLLRHSLQLAGARFRDAESVQVAFDLDGEPMRVQYTRVGIGWQVTGRIPSSPALVEHSGSEAPVDRDGTFLFDAREPEETGFVVVLESGRIEIPPISEAVGESD